MHIESFRDYCMAKPGVTESFPFDDKILVFKVMDKMFAATDVDNFESINLKCDPERALALRTENAGILPGYHMSKKHWNTCLCDGSVADEMLVSLIDHSYDLVVSKLTKKLQAELKSMMP